MADEIERIRIVIDDQDSKVNTDRANANITSVEVRAGAASEAAILATERQSKRLVTISQSSQAAINRVVASLGRKTAEAEGGAIGGLEFERAQTLKRVAGNSQAVSQVNALYEKRISLQRELNALSRQGEEREKARGIASAVAEAQRLGATSAEREALRRQDILARAGGDAKAQLEINEAFRKADLESQRLANLASEKQEAEHQAKLKLERSAALLEAQRVGAVTPQQRLALQKQGLLSRVGNDAAAIGVIEDEFKKAEAAATENLPRIGYRIQQFVTSPTIAAGDAITQFGSEFGKVALVAGGVVVGLGIVVAGAFSLITGAASRAKETFNLADRLGATNEQAYRLSAAAKVAGVEIGSLDGFMRRLSQALADGGEEGKRGAEGLRAIGVNARDSQGHIKPTVTLINEISAALIAIPDKAVQEAKFSAFGGRGAIELLPMFLRLQGINSELDTLQARTGLNFKGDLITKLAEANTDLEEFGVLWDIIKGKVAGGLIKSGKGGVAIFDLLTDPRGIRAKQQAQEVQQALDEIAKAQNPPESLSQHRLLTTSIKNGDTLLSTYQSKLDNVTALQEKISDAETKLKQAEAVLQPGTEQGVQATNIAAATAARNLVESLKDRLKLMQAIPGVEKSAHEELLKALKSEQVEITKARFETLGYTAAQITGYAAVTAAAESYITTIKKLRDEGTLSDRAKADIAAKLIADARAGQQQIAAATIKRTEDELKLDLAANEKRAKFDEDYNNATLRISNATIDAKFSYEETIASQSRDAQLRTIENTNAKTLDQKIKYELLKGEVEAQYIQRREKLQLEAQQREVDIDIQGAQFELAARVITYEQYNARVAALTLSATEKERQSRITADAEINTVRQAAAIKSAEAIRDANTRVFDSFKRESEGIFDAMLTKSQNIFQAIGNAFKNIILTTVKDVLSTQTARLLTQVFTGQHVGLTPENPASGIFGSLQRTLGIGAKPTFGDTTLRISKLEQANHIGDVQLISTPVGSAMPVVIANPGDVGGGGGNVVVRSTSNNFTLGGIGGGRGGGRSTIAASLALALGLPGLAGASSSPSVNGGGGAGAGIATSTIDFGSGPVSTGPGAVFGGGGGSGGSGGGGSIGFGSGSGFGGLQIPGLTTNGGAFESNPLGGGSTGGSSSGGGSNSIFGGILSKLASGKGLAGLKNAVFNSGGILIKQGVGTTAAGIQQALGGGIIGKVAGGAAGFVASPLAASLGAGLFLSGVAAANKDPHSFGAGVSTVAGGTLAGASIGASIPVLGLQGGALIGGGIGLLTNGLQRGGKLGILEDAAGGAAIGFQLGGPIGAAIGAAAGAAAGTVRLFISTKVDQIRERIKSVYGVDIPNRGILNQVKDIIDKQFGGSISAGILSVPVRNLIQLYALSTGQNGNRILGTPQAAKFSNTNGVLTAQPTYFNGSPVFPGDTQSPLGIPSLNPNGSYGSARVPVGANVVNGGHTTLQLDADATTALLQGQAATTLRNQTRLVAQSAQAGTSEQGTQRQYGIGLFNPSLITS